MGEGSPFRLILASGSTARQELLAEAGYQFEVLPSDIEEPGSAGFADARHFVQHVAWLKAAAVASRLRQYLLGQQAIVLAADTVGWLHGQAVGKPGDECDARRILRLLAGTVHDLWTGVCLWRLPDGWQLAWQEVSRVAMRPMAEPDLDFYLRSRAWQGCSGAYAIQDGDDPYVTVVEGSRTNVIGLPMESLATALPLIQNRGGRGG
jgi:septum formation protein